jgi:C1A family cysteine protease/acylphosphatase
MATSKSPQAAALKTLSTALTKGKARWRAGETTVSLLDEKARARLLGAMTPSPEAEVVMKAAAAKPKALAAAPGFAPAVDWRSKGGNHITGVKQQGGCGSCVSFGTVGLLEAMAHIETNQWIDLSEADSHFCSSHGANCGGWWPDQSLDQINARGVCDEAGFPYPTAFPGGDIWAGPPKCVLAPNRPARVVKHTARHALTDATMVKNHLSSVGPVTGCFDVYQDFFSYKSGVYHHVSGTKAGGHCVLVIGYSEAEGCWIIKNSWDTTWGSGGFGKIAYGDMVFNGSFYPMYGATGLQLPQSGWKPLGGVITTEPVATNNQDGRIEVFARGADNALWHIWQTTPNDGWSGWASLGGVITNTPCALPNADGRLEVFARGTDGALHHRWQTAPNNGWSGWASMGGGITSDAAAARHADGRIAVFVRGTDGQLYVNSQGGPQQGWTGWSSLGVQFIGNPAVGTNKDGRMEVFMRATNGALIHAWQVEPNGGWSSWASRGGVITSDPAVGRNADGRLEVFARGNDNALWHTWQNAPNNGWSGWASRGGSITTNPVIGRNADGRLEIFARGTDNALWNVWQTAPGGGWSGWSSMGGGLSSDCAVVNNKDGRFEVLARGSDNALWRRWQTAPSNGWN